MKSYTASARGPGEFAREIVHLVRAHSRDAGAEMRALAARLSEVEELVQSSYGTTLEGLRMLDVGAGQRMLEMKYFSVKNTVVGIDRDVIVEGIDPRAYLRLLMRQGVNRTAKTIGRKSLGIDRRQTRELAKVLRVRRFPKLTVRQMDAAKMTFESDSFDFVYSFAVFQHLENPHAVVEEMRRVVKPGGVFYADFILYTGRTGAHDLRLMGGRTAEIPLWAHLRPDKSQEVRQTAYLNRLRLPEWRSMFDERLPGCELVLKAPEREWLEPEALKLQAEGELQDYGLEELLTAKVMVVWQKPTKPVEARTPAEAAVAH